MDYKEHHELNEEFLKMFPLEKLKDTVTGTKKGRTMGMMGVIETEKVPSKCPKCGGEMKEIL